MRRFVLGLIVAITVLGLPLAALATPGANVTVVYTERATLPGDVKAEVRGLLKIKTMDDIDIVNQSVILAPGGHTGWHSHPGPVFVSVVGGDLTLYDRHGRRCTSHTVPNRGAFVDQGSGHVHIARNEGTTPIQLYITYLIPVGADARIDVPAPPVKCTFNR